MFKDGKIERTRPRNRVLVTVNKSKNREEIRRHLFFVYSIVYTLTRKSLHHVDPEGKRGILNNFFYGPLRCPAPNRFKYHFRRQISLPFLDNPKTRFRFLLVRLTSARSAWRASLSRSRLVASVGHFIYPLPFHIPET